MFTVHTHTHTHTHTRTRTHTHCVTNAPVNISPTPPGRDETVGLVGDLTILEIKCPTPGAWFHR